MRKGHCTSKRRLNKLVFLAKAETAWRVIFSGRTREQLAPNDPTNQVVFMVEVWAVPRVTNGPNHR